MNVRIIVDSTTDLAPELQGQVQIVPLTVSFGTEEYIDGITITHEEFYDKLIESDVLPTTSQATPAAFEKVFEEVAAAGDSAVVITVASQFSGTCQSARIAAEDYERLHPGCRVLVVDTLSTGPEMELVVERLRLLHEQGRTLDEMAEEIARYRKSTHLVFALQIMRSLVNNGRVSPAVATLAGLMNIRLVGIASKEGTLQLVRKCRGEKRTLEGLLSVMEEHGYAGGRVRIAHCENPEAAQALMEGIHARFPEAEVSVRLTRGLCSYYAEQGGILIGYEG